MKDLLQGKIFGHPLHPLLVHFPIALFLLTLVLDILTLIFQSSSIWVEAAFWSLAFGVGMALLAAVPGLVDFSDIRRGHPAKRLALLHMVLNLIAVALYAASLGFRWGALDATRTPPLPLFLSLAAFALVAYSGHIGGRMIYEDGIAVGRHRRRTTTPQETLQATESESGWFDVCPEEQLKEGSSLRVQARDNVIVLARQNHEIFAFQEFCTHRFGPLSEGTFHDGQVKCPWHQSCFDMRTGAVTKGPAKVDLKTYAVTVRNNRVVVKISNELTNSRA